MDGMKQLSGAIATLSTRVTSSPNALQIREENNTRKTINRTSILVSGPHSADVTLPRKCNGSVTRTECNPTPLQNSQAKNPTRFSKRTRVYLIPTHEEYSDEEYAGCWRGDEDEISSQEHLVATVQMARKHRSSIPSTHANVMTTRGIEHLCSSDAMQLRKCAKKAYLDAVLDEQDRQWTNDIDKTETGKEALRAIATRHSKRSKELAIARALEDASFAKSMSTS